MPQFKWQYQPLGFERDFPPEVGSLREHANNGFFDWNTLGKNYFDMDILAKVSIRIILAIWVSTGNIIEGYIRFLEVNICN